MPSSDALVDVRAAKTLDGFFEVEVVAVSVAPMGMTSGSVLEGVMVKPDAALDTMAMLALLDSMPRPHCDGHDHRMPLVH